MKSMGIRLYVGLLSAFAVVLSAAVYNSNPVVPLPYFQAAMCFAGLGALSWLLGYKKAGRRESGSIAFLPILASVIVAPHYVGVWT